MTKEILGLSSAQAIPNDSTPIKLTVPDGGAAILFLPEGTGVLVNFYGTVKPKNNTRALITALTLAGMLRDPEFLNEIDEKAAAIISRMLGDVAAKVKEAKSGGSGSS